MATKHPLNLPLSVSFAPDTDAYTANDVVGGLLVFEGIARSGLVVSVVLSEDDNEGAAFELWVFDSEPSTIVDNAPFAPTIADLQKLVTKIVVAANDYTTVNSLKVAEVKLTTNLPFMNTKLWGYLVAQAGETFAASKTVTIRMIVQGTS